MRQITRFYRLWLATAALLGVSLGGAMGQNWPISESARQEWQAVGRVTLEGNARSLCTGTLIAPDTVVTAAHCVTNGETGLPVPFYKLNFVAGWHDGEHAGGAVASFVRVRDGFAEGAGATRPKLAQFAADLAVITLKTPLLGVVPMPVAAQSEPKGAVTVLGYQHNRREVLTDYIGCQSTAMDPDFLGLSCAVVSGTSGGPVFEKTAEGWALVGVVVANTGQSDSAIKGLAVRVDQTRLAPLLQGS
jgi:V8-like Glu-specific endopeptidase